MISLAERTFHAIAEAWDDEDACIEIINRALLEAQADFVATDCSELTTPSGKWWSAKVDGESQLFGGELPPEGTLVKTLQGKAYIAGHRA